MVEGGCDAAIPQQKKQSLGLLSLATFSNDAVTVPGKHRSFNLSVRSDSRVLGQAIARGGEAASSSLVERVDG